MIKCGHKHELGAVNKGIVVEKCLLYGNMVNDEICRNCKDRVDSFEAGPTLELDFLKRPDEEMQSVKKCCDSCPLFQASTQTCKSSFETIPVDVLAQNPSIHCPEGLW